MALKYPLPHAVRHAQDLRKRTTNAETVLWNAVRNRKFRGLKFRRQVPVGRFIADFLCTEPALIIELDGPIHNDKTRQDQERSDLIMLDYKIPVLRLKNEEVLQNLDSALKKIASHLVVIQNKS